MRNSRLIVSLATFGAILALALIAFASTQDATPSEAGQNTMLNCPEAGKWAISVWGGPDSTDASQALATCGDGGVAAAYSLDPSTQGWLRWFDGRPEASNLQTLDNMQGIVALGGPEASATASPGSSAQQSAIQNCPPAGRWAISVWSGDDGTPAEQALSTCGEGAVAAAYYIDPVSQDWSRWFAGRPEMTTLPALDNMRGVIALGAVIASTPTPTATSTPTPGAVFSRVIFLHHSVGESLIEQGDVRQRLTALGYEFYDHGYNDDGLVLADGTWTGLSFDVPDDNTDPDGLADIFAQPLHDPPDNTFSYLMQYDVIAFKSCYPVTEIQSDEQLAEYKSYYLSIRDRMDQYPSRVFIVVTPPPQVAAYNDPESAARARTFANWLASDEYLSGHPNVFTFDLFDLLAGPSTNTLRDDYQADEDDAHPNELANQTIGPLFADFIDQAVRTYTGRW